MGKILHDLDQILTAVRTLNQTIKRQRKLINNLKARNDRQFKMITNQREVIQYMQGYIKSEF